MDGWHGLTRIIDEKSNIATIKDGALKVFIAETFKSYTGIWIKKAGNQGDTIKIIITEKNDIILTLSSLDAGNELNTAISLKTLFNNSIEHNPPWFATVEKIDNDYIIINIKAKKSGNNDSIRSEHGNFLIESTGNTEAYYIYDDITKRPVTTSISNESHEQKKYLLVNNDEKQPFKRTWFLTHLKNLNNIEMNINASINPIIYNISADANYDIYITELRWYMYNTKALILNFMDIVGGLTNGIEFSFKSLNEINIMFVIKKIWDLYNYFAYPNVAIRSIEEPVYTFLTTSRKFKNPILLKNQNTYQTNDYLQVKLNDNFTSLNQMRCAVFGYKESILV